MGCLLLAGSFAACAVQKNPYATTNKSYKAQVKAYAQALRATPGPTPGADSLLGKYWVGTPTSTCASPTTS